VIDWSESPNVTEETYNAVQWGKKLERERIIALLNEQGDLALTQIQDGQWVYSIAELIALIKGDDK
jgi:hypothetical protein